MVRANLTQPKQDAPDGCPDGLTFARALLLHFHVQKVAHAE